MKKRINIGFSRFSDANFENEAAHVVGSITANPAVFANPNPDAATLATSLTRYSTALVAAANRGRNEVAEKNAARQALESQLQALAMYVMNIANGDEKILVLSGFPLRKENGLRYISTPANFTISNGITSGELVSSVSTDKAARVYEHQYTDNYQGEATVWNSVNTSVRRYTHTGLTPGRQYWFRVGLKGSREQSAYTTVISMYAQ